MTTPRSDQGFGKDIMKTTPHLLPTPVINLFFVIGVISAVCFRILLVVQHLQPQLFRMVWYVGVLGYIVFFIYRYAISQKRRQAIERFELIQKIEKNTALAAEDREVLIYLLNSIQKSKENINYLVIFTLSVAAIIADICM